MEMEDGNGKTLIHVRFKQPIKDWVTSWLESHSSKFAVCEEVGVKHEGLHYHTCFLTDLTKSSILKKFCAASKTAGVAVAAGKANGVYGATKECTDESYVFKAGKVIAVKGYTPARVEELIAEGSRKYRHKLPEAARQVDPATNYTVTVKSPQPRLTQSEKMVKYCVTELRWKIDGQFDVESYTSGTCKDQCAKYAVIFTRGRFNDPQAISLLRHLLYEFADPELKLLLEKKYTQHAINYL